MTTCAPRATFTSQAWRSISGELAGADDALGLGGQGEREDDRGRRRAGRRCSGRPRARRRRRPCRCTRLRTTVTWQSNGSRSRSEGLGDPAAAEDGDPGAEEVAADAAAPTLGPGVRAEPAQAGRARDRGPAPRPARRTRPCRTSRGARRPSGGCSPRSPRTAAGPRRGPARGRATSARPPGSRGLAQTSPSAFSAGTTWPPPAMIAVSSHSGAPSGASAMRGG